MSDEKKFGELFYKLGKLIWVYYHNMKYKPREKDVDRFFEAEKPVIVCRTIDKT